MHLNELTDDERLALSGLLRFIIAADGRFSPEEAATLGRRSAELGGAEVYRLLADAQRVFADEDSVRIAAKAVTRENVRAFMYQLLAELAHADGMSAEESSLLGWLRVTWHLR